MGLTESEYRLVHKQVLNTDAFWDVVSNEDGQERVSFGRRNRVLKRRGISWEDLRQKAREVNKADGEIIDQGKHYLVIQPKGEGPDRVYVDRKWAGRLPREKNANYNFMRSGYQTEDGKPLFRVLPQKRHREVEVKMLLGLAN